MARSSLGRWPLEVVRVGDVEVHYREVGVGRPLLALHGLTVDHRAQLLSLEPVLADKPGWRRIYPDLPGHGRTRAGERIGSHDDVLDVVDGFVEALLGEERFAVAGLSWGGLLAHGLQQRRRDQIEGVLLTVPLVPDSALPQHQIRYQQPGFEAALRPGEEHQREFAVWQTVEVLEAIRAHFDSGAELVDRGFLERLGAYRPAVLVDDQAQRPFERAALIVCGRFDAWCGYDGAYRLLEQYPFATFAVLDCAGHGLTVEREPLYHALVRDWVNRIEAATT